jgi:hypothetical protein
MMQDKERFETNKERKRRSYEDKPEKRRKELKKKKR